MHGEMRQSRPRSPSLGGSEGDSDTCTAAAKPHEDTKGETVSRETASKRLSFGIDQILDRGKTSSRKCDSLTPWKDCHSSCECPPAYGDHDNNKSNEGEHYVHSDWPTQTTVLPKLTYSHNEPSADSLHQVSHNSSPSLPTPNPFCTQLTLSGTSVASGSFCSSSLTSGLLSNGSLSSGHLNSYTLDVVARLRSEGSRPVWGPAVRSVDNFEFRGMGGHHSTLLEHPLFSWPGSQRDRFGGE